MFRTIYNGTLLGERLYINFQQCPHHKQMSIRIPHHGNSEKTIAFLLPAHFGKSLFAVQMEKLTYVMGSQPFCHNICISIYQPPTTHMHTLYRWVRAGVCSTWVICAVSFSSVFSASFQPKLFFFSTAESLSEWEIHIFDPTMILCSRDRLGESLILISSLFSFFLTICVVLQAFLLLAIAFTCCVLSHIHIVVIYTHTVVYDNCFQYWTIR